MTTIFLRCAVIVLLAIFFFNAEMAISAVKDEKQKSVDYSKSEASKLSTETKKQKNLSKKKSASSKKKVARKKSYNELALEKAKKLSGVSPFEIDAEFKVHGRIDEVILEHLKKKNLTPAKLCSDAVFVRRVYLDLTGRIPTSQQAQSFIDDKSTNKREKLVDSLISSDEFNQYFSMLFCDFLRVKAEFPINLWPNAAQAYHRFIYKSLADNVPYNEMVRRVLVSTGSNFRCGEVNFFRAMQAKNPEGIAAAVALSFMAMRYEALPKEKQQNMSAFFSRVAYKSTKEWKEEIVYDNPAKVAPFKGKFLDGTEISLDANQKPRVAFAQWLCEKGNPYLSRAIVNRMWTWLFGTSIVSPVDDMFAKREKACEKLLDVMAKDFEESNFDIKKFCKNVVMSRAYQQSSIPQSEPEAARKNFAVYGMRQMSAEQLIDALCKISGTSESYSSTTPEPYTTMPDDASAVSIPDGSVTSSFLELFGKPSRDTGLVSERVLAPSSSQRLHMINSSHVRAKIERAPVMNKIYAMGGGQRAFENLSLTILSRYPTYEERLAFVEYAKKNKNTRHRLIDIAWAMINSEEFINRH